jgi:ABC-2 type transport system permease protein
MRLFLKLSKLAFQRQMSYRAVAIAGLMTNFFFGLLRAAIMIALYQNQIEVEGMDLSQAITFTAIGQAVIGYLSMFHWYEQMQSVYTGEIATDLLKPMGYFRYWLAKDFGRAAAALLTRGVVIFLAFELVFDLVYPQSILEWLYLLIALLLAWLVSFCWRFLANLPSFWMTNARGIGIFVFMSAQALSGFIMPLRFFPEWFQTFANFTPFPHSVNTIVEVQLGLLNSQQVWLAFANQLLWALGMILVIKIVLRAGVRKLVVVGG